MPSASLSNFFLLEQIEEVALVTDKGSDNRRGFVFVTYTSEAPVDKVTEKSFHKIDSATVRMECDVCSLKLLCVCVCVCVRLR